MAWKITHDLINDGSYGIESRVGRGVDLEALKATPVGDRLTARLLDDDLEHYYTISATPDAYEGDGRGSLEHAWEWAMHDAGVTHCCIKLEDAVSLGMPEDIAQRIAFTSGQHKGWVTLFA